MNVTIAVIGANRNYSGALDPSRVYQFGDDFKQGIAKLAKGGIRDVPGDWLLLCEESALDKVDDFLGQFDAAAFRKYDVLKGSYFQDKAGGEGGRYFRDMDTVFYAARRELIESWQFKPSDCPFSINHRVAASALKTHEVSIGDAPAHPPGAFAKLWRRFRSLFTSNELFLPGMNQTLTTLDHASEFIYAPLLRRGLQHIPGGRLLEVGAGIGSLTQVSCSRFKVLATDICDNYVQMLERRFCDNKNVSVKKWDASKAPPEDWGKFDGLVSFNVLEHIEDDETTLKIWKSQLKDEGVMIVLVPYGKWLYSPIDKAVHHHRRYNKSELSRKVENAGFDVVEMYFGNCLGILGWVLNGLILRKSDINSSQLKLYAKLKPILAPFESLIEKFVGLNIVVVARKRPN